MSFRQELRGKKEIGILAVVSNFSRKNSGSNIPACKCDIERDDYRNVYINHLYNVYVLCKKGV